MLDQRSGSRYMAGMTVTAAGHCVTQFDRFRSIPGSVDISIAQGIRLRRQTLTSYKNIRSPEISVSSIDTRQLRQRGILPNMAGERTKNRAGDRSTPVSLTLCAVRRSSPRWGTRFWVRGFLCETKAHTMQHLGVCRYGNKQTEGPTLCPDSNRE